MLLEISIKNLLIIEQEVINFRPGLNIITGETGSGKSLVIDALTTITGGRFSKEDIRSGASKAIIEALFSIEDNAGVRYVLEEYGIELEEDNTLLITREVSTSSKSVCRVNGQIVTLSMLKNITQYLVDIVGQHEHQLLFNTGRHIDFVDSFGGVEIGQIKGEIGATTEKLRKVEKKLEEICGNSKERERRLDLYKFQIDDIDGARLVFGEGEELVSKRLRLINAEKLFKNISMVYQSIFKGEMKYKSVTDILNDCTHTLNELSTIDAEIGRFKTTVENVLYQLDDIKNELRQYRDEIEFNDDEINNIEERIDLLNKLKRKYGNSIEEILEYRNNIAVQYEELINSESIAKELEKEIEDLKLQYVEGARKLSAMRRSSAAELEKMVEQELQDLNMHGAKFIISQSQDEAHISSKGFDKVEFLLSPNPGEPPRPLSKIASGGEMSRVMLSIKNVLSRAENTPSIIFDEVDAGIGGLTATMVGQKIKRISKMSQTICITHLPQIASCADNHIYIDKMVKDDKTFTKIKALNYEERIHEIARMLGGGDLKSSLVHAKQLIKNK